MKPRLIVQTTDMTTFGVVHATEVAVVVADVDVVLRRRIVLQSNAVHVKAQTIC